MSIYDPIITLNNPSNGESSKLSLRDIEHLIEGMDARAAERGEEHLDSDLRGELVRVRYGKLDKLPALRRRMIDLRPRRR